MVESGFTPIPWRTVENALSDWVHDVAGIEATWENQSAPQPAYPYAALNILTGPTELGTGDEKRLSEKTKPDGSGLDLWELETRGQREITFTCQINVGPKGSNNPDCHARALATRLLASLDLEEFWRPLDTAGISVIQPLPITDLSLVVANDFIDRKVLEVRFGLASSVVEDIEIVEKAVVEGEVTKPDNSTLTVGPITIDSTL